MNYKKMSFISGIVIFFSILILFVSIIGLAEKRIFFTRDYIVYVKFTDIAGLQDQARVYMRGYRIGWTKKVQFQQDGVIVRVDINKKYQIPADSHVELNTVSLLGEKALTIMPGSSGKYLQAGAVLTGENKDLMIEMKKVLGQFRGDLEKGDIQAKVVKLGESIDFLHSVLSKMDKKINHLNFAEYNKQIKNVGLAGSSVKNFMDQNSDSLKASFVKFDKAITEITHFSQQANLIATKINQGHGSTGQFVNNDEYLKNVNETVTELRTLIVDFKKNPKKYIDVSVF